MTIPSPVDNNIGKPDTVFERLNDVDHKVDKLDNKVNILIIAMIILTGSQTGPALWTALLGLLR